MMIFATFVSLVLALCPHVSSERCSSFQEDSEGRCVCALPCSSETCELQCPPTVDVCQVIPNERALIISLSGCESNCELLCSEGRCGVQSFACEGHGTCLLRGSKVGSLFVRLSRRISSSAAASRVPAFEASWSIRLRLVLAATHQAHQLS
jgi:hypothetical protein